MPINLYLSDIASTQFGDEHNFQLSGNAFNFKSVNRATVMMLTPSSKIAYKLCKARKK